MPAVTADTLTLARISAAGPADTERPVRSVTTGPRGYEGEGFPVVRAFAGVSTAALDPFVHMDQMGEVDYQPGEPRGTDWHPHRGFETVTYMISGRMRHRDSHGHEGLLSNGGVQWMTAGRGLIHSELPEQEEGLMEGFQLWLNLPARDKMREPWYRDIQSEEIPEFTTPAGVRVRVIAGESHGIAGAMKREHTEPLYLDIALPPGAEFAQPLASRLNALVYVFRESLYIGRSEIPTKRMAILANDPNSDGVVLRAPPSNHSPARALLIAGKPLREPIAQYGPFVMNTREQVMQAVQDFQSGKLG